jgi:hypothetical protein
MAKSNKQINKEADVNDTDSSPAVVAYRVSSLETVVKDGFKEHNEKLDKLINNFATKEELMAVQRQLDNYKWFLRAVAAAVLTVLGGLVVSLLTKGK